MGIWAIVPVKPLQRGKSRLAGILSEYERTKLNTNLLINTLNVLLSIPEIQQVLVVSRDPTALAIAREQGANTLQEDGAPHLNTALRRAVEEAKRHSATGVLILPADIPLLKPEDITGIFLRSVHPPVVTIVPDRHHNGTNAMFQSSPGIIDFAFGTGSYQKHCDRVSRTTARLEILESITLGLDLDLPEDLELLKKMQKEQMELPIFIT